MNASIENDGSEVIIKFGRHNQSLMLLVNIPVVSTRLELCSVIKPRIHACYCIYWDQDAVVGNCILTCFYTSRTSTFYPIERYSIYH